MYCTSSEHSTIDIQSLLLSRIQHWLVGKDPSKVLAVTSDNGTNVVDALRNLGVPFMLVFAKNVTRQPPRQLAQVY